MAWAKVRPSVEGVGAGRGRRDAGGGVADGPGGHGGRVGGVGEGGGGTSQWWWWWILRVSARKLQTR